MKCFLRNYGFAPPSAVLLALTLSVILTELVGWAQIAQHAKTADQLPRLRQLSEKYGIEIATKEIGFPIKTIHGLIDGSDPSSESLQKYQKLLTTEFDRYPVKLVRNSKVVRIVLCEDLTFDNQRRGAIPDFEKDVLYLDVSRGDYNPQYQRKVIHHEFFHLIDYKDDGSVYSDNVWAALNPSTFQYGNGGRTAQDDPSTSVLTDRFTGFLNHYSTTGVEEDKAEMFANMMVVPKHVDHRASEDPVIQAKLSAMKSLLQTFCPEVNEDFWKQNH